MTEYDNIKSFLADCNFGCQVDGVMQEEAWNTNVQVQAVVC